MKDVMKLEDKTSRILAEIFVNDVDTFKETLAREELGKMIKQYLTDNDADESLNASLFVKDIKKQHWKPKDHFTKVFNYEIKHAVDTYGITKSELAFLYSLCPFLKWELNIIVNENDEAINQQQLADLLGIDRRTVNRNMKSLGQKKIIIYCKLGKETFYLVNPYLFYCGQNINIHVPMLFDTIGYEKCRSNRRETVTKRTKVNENKGSEENLDKNT